MGRHRVPYRTCVISADECAGGALALRIDGLDFLPLQFKGTISLAQWRWLHIDMWAPTEDQVCFKLQNWWPGETYVSDIYNLKAGKWTSIDIDMEDPEYFQWSEIKTDPETQEKYTNNKSFRPALTYFLSSIKTLYPGAELLYIVNDGLKSEITNSIIETCGHYGIPYLCLEAIDKTAGHPNIHGMRQIADQVGAYLRK